METSLWRSVIAILLVSAGILVVIFPDHSYNQSSNLVTQVVTFKHGNRKKHTAAKSTRPKKLLLVTEFRSGSTFLSELFNQNNEAFYMFEPLIGASVANERSTLPKARKPEINNLKLNIIRDILDDCKPNDVEAMMDEFNVTAEDSILEKCAQKNICFDYKSTWYTNIADQYPSNTVPVSKITEVCEQSTLRVIKVIRIYAIERLQRPWPWPRPTESLPPPRTLDDSTKIIYLVRDIRALANSRENLNRKQDPHAICSNYRRNLNYFKTATSDWLRGKLLIVRYEDLASRPFFMARKIYQRLGYDDTPEMVKLWIEKNTKTDDGSTHPEFSTKRNSNETLYKWMDRLDFGYVKDIQDNCGDVIRAFGYKIFSDENEYKINRRFFEHDWSDNSIRFSEFLK